MFSSSAFPSDDGSEEVNKTNQSANGHAEERPRSPLITSIDITGVPNGNMLAAFSASPEQPDNIASSTALSSVTKSPPAEVFFSNEHPSLFDNIVSRIEDFLIDIFHSHPVLKTLVIPQCACSESLSFSLPSATLVDESPASVQDSQKRNSLIAMMKHVSSDLALDVGSPMVDAAVPVKSPPTRSLEDSPSPSREKKSLNLSRTPPRSNKLEESPLPKDSAHFVQTSDEAAASALLTPLCIIKDFPLTLSSFRPPSRTPVKHGPPSAFPRHLDPSSPSSYSIRIEIHYRDDAHEIARNHGLTLFLVARCAPMDAAETLLISSKAATNSPASQKLNDAESTINNKIRKENVGLIDRVQEEIWVSAAHTSQSQSSFHLSALWTAANSVFSPGGPLQLDLQHFFHQHYAFYGISSVLHPPPFLRCGASLRLPSIFAPSFTCVPCFAGSAMLTSSISPSGLNTGNGAKTISNAVATAIVGNVETPNAGSTEIYQGISSIHSYISNFHQQLVKLASSAVGSSMDAGRCSTPSLRQGGSRSTSPHSSSQHYQPRIVTEFVAMPPFSTTSLNPLVITSGKRSTTINPGNFALAGHEMIRYLVELFRLQLGPNACTRPWMRGKGLPLPTNSVSVPINRTTSRRGSRSGVGGSLFVEHDEPACCISLRKTYHLHLYRQPSNSLNLPWGSSDTLWEHRLSMYNQILRRRCGGTTYPVGVHPRPVEYVSFTFQWSQLGEEDAQDPTTLDPFVFPQQQSDAKGSEKISAPGLPSSKHLQPNARESSSIKARATVRKRDEFHHKAGLEVQKVLRCYLNVLRYSFSSSGGFLSARSSTHGGGSLGGSRNRLASDSDEGVGREALSNYEIRELVQKMVKRPDGEPAVQAALVKALVVDSMEDVLQKSRTGTNDLHRSSQVTNKRMTMLMEEEQQQEERRSKKLLSAHRSHNVQQPFSGGREVLEQEESSLVEAEELSLLLRGIALEAENQSHHKSHITRSPEPVQGKTNDDGPSSGISKIGIGNTEGAQQSQTSRTGSYGDVRLGYLPGSFLCRFAFFAGDMLVECEGDNIEEKRLCVLDQGWHSCIDELEERLLAYKKTNSRKELEQILLILGLPKRRENGEDPVDLTQSLLVQKLQLLAYCVRQLHDSSTVEVGGSARAEDYSNSEEPLAQREGDRLLVDEAVEEWTPEVLQGWEADEDDNEADESAEGEQELIGGEKTKRLSNFSRRRAPKLTLITNGEVLFPPPALPQPPSTSDVLFQQSTLPLSASELNVVPPSKLYTISVYNDMCLFLYVNQGRVVRFPDFVQWVSPRDFKRPSSPSNNDNDYLSERMKVPVEESIWRGGANLDSSNSGNNPPFPTSSSNHAANEDACDIRCEATPDSIGQNNVWWALWRRATPRPPFQIISDSLRHFDEAVDIIKWIRSNVTISMLCLELSQATISNAIHRLLVDPKILADGATSSHGNANNIPSLKAFLQQKTQSIFNHLSPITGLLAVPTIPLLVGSLQSTISTDDYEMAQRALEDAVWEINEMEISVCVSMELEETVMRELFQQMTHDAPSRTVSGALGLPHRRQAEHHVVEECREAVYTLGSPMRATTTGSNERLSLSSATISLQSWQRGFAPLFERVKDRTPLDATVRLTCMAERPASTAPCFQQMVARSNNAGALRLALSLSKEVI